MPVTPIRCRFEGDDAPGAPQVYALWAADAPAGSSPEATRTLARQHARAALRALLARELGCASETILLSDVRGRPPRAQGHEQIGLSISHDQGLSLLALCVGGAVGVDLVLIDHAIDQREWLRAATLFLPSQEAAALDRPAAPEHSAVAFFHAWARHEARLKCLGQPLLEWSLALQARLAGLRTAAVVLPGPAAETYAAALAWRAGPLNW